MRAFLVFLLLFAFAAVVSGLLTYPTWSVLHSFWDVPIHRVMERIGMAALAIATVVFLRQQRLANKATLGYALPRAQFVRQIIWGYAAGILLMLPLVAALFGFQIRTLAAQIVANGSPSFFISKLVAQGLLTGITVAFLEETFCRGAMFSVIRRESGLALAILLPALLYAATHFLGGALRLQSDQVTYLSGLQVMAHLFERFATPLEFVDSFLALTALGILLALIRLRTGAIAGCIGLHAGGVTVIVVMRNLSTVNPQASMSWLVGSYDGVIGWLACAWISVAALAYWQTTRSSNP